MQGIFAINKPVGPTSHDVVNALRRLTGIKKIGHAGTLDPLASGVLIVGIGREATKQLGDFLQQDKEYITTIKLGENSTTDDAEGDKKPVTVTQPPTVDMIQKALGTFVGDIQQMPPAYSAVKAGGVKAYQRARKGQRVIIGPRSVTIHSIELLSYQWPQLQLHVRCGSGTYIRSLARDIGAALATGGYVVALERTRVGEYALSAALTLEQFTTMHAQALS